MAARTYQATVQTDRSHSVVSSTADAIGSAEAALVIDDTLSKDEVLSAARALMRRLRRDSAKANAPADFANAVTTLE